MERTDTVPRSSRTLTVHQVAERLNVSPRTVWAWLAQGRIRGIKLGPRTTRIPEDALSAFLASCGEGA
jgi:excisionase family DNA binding protein